MHIILKRGTYSSIDLMLGKLHWSNTSGYVEINVLTFIHRIKIENCPEYYNGILTVYIIVTPGMGKTLYYITKTKRKRIG